MNIDMQKSTAQKTPKQRSPIFSFLELVENGTLDVLPNVKKSMSKTSTSDEKGAKPLLLLTLPKTYPSIELDGELYLIRENHVSIYKHYEDNPEKMFGMSAYHYTATLHKSGCRATLHTFYDMYGNYKGYNIVLSVGSEKSYITLLNEQPIKSLSGMHILPVIQEIGEALDTHVCQQQKEIDKLSKQVCHVSRAVFKPEREPTVEGEHFNNYIRLANHYADLTEQLNRLVFSPNFALPKLLRETVANLMARKQSKTQVPKPKKLAVKKTDQSKKEVPNPEPIPHQEDPNQHQTIGAVEEKTLTKKKKKIKKKKDKASGFLLSDLVKADLKELETLRAKEKENDPQSILRRYTLILQCMTLLDSRQIIVMLELSSEKEQLIVHAQNLIDILAAQGKLDDIKVLIEVAKEVSAKSVIMSALFGKCDTLVFLLQYFKRSINLVHKHLTLLCNEKLPIETMQILLERGANPNIVNLVGMTPLMVAADKGDVAKIDLLIRFGANVNYQLRQPRIVAYQLKNSPKANRFAATLKSLMEEPDELTTALFFAVSTGSLAAVTCLVEAGTNLELLNHKGFSAYSIASVVSTNKAPLTAELEQILRYFYKTCQCDINKLFGPPGMRSTILHLAVQFRRPDYVKFLLELGADPNVLRDKNEADTHYFTPLLFAIAREFYEIVEIILTQPQVFLSNGNILQAFILCKNKDTKTLLYRCLTQNLIAMSKEGLDTSIEMDNFRQPLLHWLINVNAIDEVEDCLKRGVDPNLCRHDGVSSLGIAINLGRVEFVSAILENKNKPITAQTLSTSRAYTCTKNKKEINELLDAYEDKLIAEKLGEFFYN